MTNQNFDEQSFYQEYWRKKPCVIKNMFSEMPIKLEGEDLAGLALEAEAQSRLIFGADSETPFKVKDGPFKQKDFEELRHQGYSLMVQAVERFIPELELLKAPFQKIARWRFDDIMVSFSNEGGGVGAHYDNYDVFLIQGKGRRRWRFHSQPVANRTHIDGIDILVLSEPQLDSEIEVCEGDVLYIPPGFAHEGTSLEPAITYSVGFRAPGYQDILEGLKASINRTDPWLYSGEDRPASPNQISHEMLENIKGELLAYLETPHLLEKIVGSLVTEPRAPLPWETAKTDVSQLKKDLCDSPLTKAPGLRWVLGEKNIYIEGQPFGISSQEKATIEEFFQKPMITLADFSQLPDDLQSLISQWVTLGFFWLD